MTFIELALLTTMSATSPDSDTKIFTPSVKFQKETSALYLKMNSSAKFTPKKPVAWNPERIKWVVEVGVYGGNWRAGVGRQAEYGIDKDKVFDFLKINYKREF